MLKRSLFLLVCLALLLGATSSSALAGPPWPAEVVTPTDGWCVMPWLAWVNGEATFIDVYGTYSYAYQPKSGMWNASCHLFIDFNDPSMLSIDEVCAMFPDTLSCSHATLQWNGWECTGPYGLITYDSHYVVNPSGHSTSMCHSHP